MNTHALAVDLGATNLRVALVASDGKIIERIKDETPKKGRDGTVISGTIARMIESLIVLHPRARMRGIGISSIGPLDYRRGGPLHSPNIPFAFVPLVQPLQKRFSLSVLLLNDANAAVRGEQRFGAGKKKKNMVYVTISTGIGGGAIIDDNLLLGKSGNATEIGHMTVDTTYNLPCACNKGVGHWEGYASGRNIPRFFYAWAARAHEKTSGLLFCAKDIFDRARAGDRVILRFLDELNRINARAISNIIVSYDPELITIGGSVMLHNAPLLLPGIRKYRDTYFPTPLIRVTKLGEDVTLLGAAAALFDAQAR